VQVAHLDESVRQQAGDDGDQAVAQEHGDAERVAQPVGLVAALHGGGERQETVSLDSELQQCRIPPQWR